MTRPPSAELGPDQKDSDSLPPYDILDPILEAFIEKDYSVDQIAALGFDRETVGRVLGLVKRAEYKRRQAPPGVSRISGRAFRPRLALSDHIRLLTRTTAGTAGRWPDRRHCEQCTPMVHRICQNATPLQLVATGARSRAAPFADNALQHEFPFPDAFTTSCARSGR
jgi:hypothetical protein